MKHGTPLLLLLLPWLTLACVSGRIFAVEKIEALPPPPLCIFSAEHEAALKAELAEVTQSFQEVKRHERAADIDIFLKAVRYALEFHEWYDANAGESLKKARTLLAEARARITALSKQEEPPWLKGSGFKVLGFYSEIDGSPQPYGVEIPKGLAEDEFVETAAPGFGSTRKPPPVCVWLHDRDETLTDMGFVHAHLTARQPALIRPEGAIVIQPFGRYCNGWKFAGEKDVMECLYDMMQRYRLDWDRVALAGFGMGGFGAMHLGAHYGWHWACVHAGGCFLTVKPADDKTPWYEQKLQGMYDVTSYTRNYMNIPLCLYHGELDSQRLPMEQLRERLVKDGVQLKQFVGPDMGREYDPGSIKEVQEWMKRALTRGRNVFPDKLSLQTRSWRHSFLHWLQVEAVDELWEDARIDAEITGAKQISVTTEGVRSFDITSYTPGLARYAIIVDDQEITLPGDVGQSTHFTKVMRDGDLACTWRHDAHWDLMLKGDPYASHKGAGTCMDDVFFERFIFVLPDGPGEHPAVDAWVMQESQHAISRWRSLMRGDPKVMTASQYLRHAQEVHEEDQQANLVLWGDAKSNPLIAMLLKHKQTSLKWDAKDVRMSEKHFDAATHVPLMLFPNECIPRKRLVDDGAGKEWTETATTGMILINSGLTFREGHDASYAQLNPKLPDWAILDITQQPDAMTPGKVVAADFFDEFWRVRQKGKE